ncbi:MAG: TraR/DksA C4-type zinc finger protein [Candidatus Lokiarchaeota archaeon]|nr:TraR/DksA C4-type zinc finger protein [Candidatus Lokiarchaeota archaeon]
MNDLVEKAVNFHGHLCPGLLIGVLASKYVLEHGNDFSLDEELAAIVENDNCSVDALQALLGTTFGKGNLIFRDYGKNNYTIFNRTNNKVMKLSVKARNFGQATLTREERLEQLLKSSPEEIFEITYSAEIPPEKAHIHESIKCDNCGEPTMSTRIRELREKRVCIPCYEKLNMGVFDIK